MINLRYHLVSIVAIFLALGIGIALGTSFIDGVIVDRLERSINDITAERNAARDEISALQDSAEILEERFDRFGDELQVGGYSRRLSDVPVMILTADGVSDAEIEPLRRALVRTGALFEGVIRFSSDFDVDDDDNVARLAALLDLDERDASAVEAELAERVGRLFGPRDLPAVASTVGATLVEVASLVAAQPGDPDLPEPINTIGPDDDLLTRLADAGLVEFDSSGSATPRLSTVPRAGSLFVIVSGPTMAPPTQTLLQMTALALLGTDPAPLVVASTADPGVPDDFLDLFRAGGPLGARVPTVDDADSVEGVTATVMAVDRIGDLPAIAYGKRDDASFLLPRR